MKFKRKNMTKLISGIFHTDLSVKFAGYNEIELAKEVEFKCPAENNFVWDIQHGTVLTIKKNG